MAARPFDISKFRKEITKNIDGLTIGFNDPTDWVSTGNYALNYLISGDFRRGIPLGKVSVFAGEPGAGKSYFCSGNIIRDAQSQGIFVVLVDSENALDESWLRALGVDTSEDKLLKLSMAMIDDVAKTISTFMSDYKNLPPEDRPKVLFVIDSLGMLLTPTDINQFETGDMKGDLGRKAKALTALVRNCVNMFGSYNVGMVCTNHTYASQNMFDPDDKISGGCLVADSLIYDGNGNLKKIQDFNVGDLVLTKDGVSTVDKTYSFLEKEIYEIEMDDGFIIQLTPEHKLLVSRYNENIWVETKDIIEGDDIVNVNDLINV